MGSGGRAEDGGGWSTGRVVRAATPGRAGAGRVARGAGAQLDTAGCGGGARSPGPRALPGSSGAHEATRAVGGDPRSSESGVPGG